MKKSAFFFFFNFDGPKDYVAANAAVVLAETVYSANSETFRTYE